MPPELVLFHIAEDDIQDASDDQKDTENFVLDCFHRLAVFLKNHQPAEVAGEYLRPLAFASIVPEASLGMLSFTSSAGSTAAVS